MVPFPTRSPTSRWAPAWSAGLSRARSGRWRSTRKPGDNGVAMKTTMRTARERLTPCAGEEQHGRLEADGDEEGQEDQDKRAPDGIDGGARGPAPRQDAHRGHKSDHERVLPVERLPQAPHGPLTGAVLRDAAAAWELSRDRALLQPGCSAFSLPGGSVSHHALAVRLRSYASWRGTVAMIRMKRLTRLSSTVAGAGSDSGPVQPPGGPGCTAHLSPHRDARDQ